MSVENLLAADHDTATLGSKEAGRLDQGFELHAIGLGERADVGKSAEKIRRDFVDPLIRTLSREDGGDRQLKRALMHKGAGRIRIKNSQPPIDPPGSSSCWIFHGK